MYAIIRQIPYTFDTKVISVHFSYTDANAMCRQNDIFKFPSLVLFSSTNSHLHSLPTSSVTFAKLCSLLLSTSAGCSCPWSLSFFLFPSAMALPHVLPPIGYLSFMIYAFQQTFSVFTQFFVLISPLPPFFLFKCNPFTSAWGRWAPYIPNDVLIFNSYSFSSILIPFKIPVPYRSITATRFHWWYDVSATQLLSLRLSESS